MINLLETNDDVAVSKKYLANLSCVGGRRIIFAAGLQFIFSSENLGIQIIVMFFFRDSQQN